MRKVWFLSAFIALSVSASAWQLNWTEGFESFSSGSIVEQGYRDGWSVPAGVGLDVVPMVVENTLVRSGSNALQQQNAQVSDSYKWVKPFTQVQGYKAGFAKFWMYEPEVSSLSSDGRVGVFGHCGLSSFRSITAGIASSNSTYWNAQFPSLSAVPLDGVTPRGGNGYTYHAYFPAQRRPLQWSYVYVSWGFDYTLKTGYAEWRVNRQTPNLRIDFDAAKFYDTIHWIDGICLGCPNVVTNAPITVDDIEFHANVVPEPSGLLAIGMCLIAVGGLIRRKS